MEIKYMLPLLAVCDTKASKDFYCGLFGLSVVMDFGLNVTFGTYKNGIPIPAFAIQQNFAWLADLPEESVCQKAHNMELYFEVDNFDELLARLEVYPNIEAVNPPKTHDWFQRVMRVYDPDGHIIEIGEAMETVARRCLAEGKTPEETAKLIQYPEEFVRSCMD